MSKSKRSYFKKRTKEGYYKQAKRLNVRARSYFKLEQLDKKFNLIKENQVILDLGSAPGGWLEYCDNKIKHSTIIGVDLLEIKNQQEFSNNVKIFQDDMRNIKDNLEGPVDLMLSDMAPEFSGDSKVDRGRTHQLNFLTLELAQDYLKQNGNLAFKTFEGEDLNKVKNKAKTLFKQVKDFKPDSSQKGSAEQFIVCLKKK